jgi:hypothetical protein
MVWSYASQGVQGSQLGAVATYTLATMVVGDNRTVVRSISLPALVTTAPSGVRFITQHSQPGTRCCGRARRWPVGSVR